MQEGGQLRFSSGELTPYLQSLLENLFGVFAILDSGENEYAMKCVMRVISFVGPQVFLLYFTIFTAFKKMHSSIGSAYASSSWRGVNAGRAF